jgi:hypothetical protein
MISVIIPTMWRSPYVVDLLNQLQGIDSVGEVILIDNDIKKSVDVSGLSKVIHTKNPKNNYVNPSWNQGYQISKHENLCFLNDDVIIPGNIFSIVDGFLSPGIGIVGLLSDIYENIMPDVNSLGIAESVRLTLCTRRNFAYGCCMFMHRSQYRLVPDGLKIQYGDDFLFYSTTKNNFVLDGFGIVGKICGTLYDDNLQLIDKEEVSAICSSDHDFFWNVSAKEILRRDPVNDLDVVKLKELSKYEAKSRTNYYFKGA